MRSRPHRARTQRGPLGPWWVARLLIAVALLGLAAALVARAKRRAFLPWLLYGVSLPLVALPHSPGCGHGPSLSAGALLVPRCATGVIEATTRAPVTPRA